MAKKVKISQEELVTVDFSAISMYKKARDRNENVYRIEILSAIKEAAENGEFKIFIYPDEYPEMLFCTAIEDIGAKLSSILQDLESVGYEVKVLYQVENGAVITKEVLISWENP